MPINFELQPKIGMRPNKFESPFVQVFSSNQKWLWEHNNAPVKTRPLAGHSAFVTLKNRFESRQLCVSAKIDYLYPHDWRRSRYCKINTISNVFGEE